MGLKRRVASVEIRRKSTSLRLEVGKEVTVWKVKRQALATTN